MKTNTIPLHPYFFAAYAILGVYATNANEIPVAQILRPLIVVFGITTIVLLSIYFVTKNLTRAEFITTLIILWVLYFGHIFFFASLFPFARNIPGSRIIITILWAGILIALGRKKTWNAIRNPATLTLVLNTISVIALLFPVVTTAYVALETNKQINIIDKWQSNKTVPYLNDDGEKPDIYYIILDGYGRNDILSEYYQYNNNQFTDFLTEEGFYIAQAGTSNYMQTELSVASLLNMDYLDYLSEGMGKSQNRGPLNDLIQNNLVRKALNTVGYKFVALPSAVLFTQIRNADEYISYSNNPISEFEGLLLTKTIFGAFIEDFDLNIPLPNYATHRKYINYDLETLKMLPEMPGPKFVFIHILAPHPPFVFDQNGMAIQPDRPYFIGDATGFLGDKAEYIKGYTNELTYINKQIMTVIKTILEKSDKRPIIILHGDHGPGANTSFVDVNKSCLQERFSILYAVYLPNQEYSNFYSNISLVNLFPAIFNTNFGSNLRYLNDKNYYATWNHPYQFLDVTNKVGQLCILNYTSGDK
jgi:hypothetical protein